DSADEAFAGEIKDGPAGEMQRRLVELIGDAVAREDVLLDLDPHERESIGSMIYVVNSFRARDDAGPRVERRTDRIARVLLPLVGRRCARARAHATGCGEREGAERRAVGDGLLERERSDGEKDEHVILR